MNAEFQWWLLILGVVVGGALVYLVLADMHDDEPLDDTTADPDLMSASAGPASASDSRDHSNGEAPDRGVASWSERLDRRR